MDKLLGGSAKDISYVFRARSPVFHADKIKVPLLVRFLILFDLHFQGTLSNDLHTQLLQGADDKVVPPSQAEDMLKVIRERGGQVEYKLFKGEGHGWRKADTIIAALETELEFYLKVMYDKRK